MIESRENNGGNKYATETEENKLKVTQIQGTVTWPNLNATFSPLVQENGKGTFFSPNKTD